MTTKNQSNGFGSFELHLLFTVKEPHSQKLKDEGWEVVERSGSGSVFKYHFTSKKRGDDETVMYDLAYSLPKDVPFDDCRIDWGRSVY